MITDSQTPDTEAKILHAAEHEFMAKGFNGARTTSIAEAAGVTHAMLHYYFRTKEKLFQRIVLEKVNILKEVLGRPLDDTNLPLGEIIRLIINRHLDFLLANPDLPHFIVSEIYSNPERSSVILNKIHDIAPRLLARLQEKLNRSAANGECRMVDARCLMLDITSLNIFAFLALPVINTAMGNIMGDLHSFVEMRKKENYDTIMRKLQP